jgi:hypothetical protein
MRVVLTAAGIALAALIAQPAAAQEIVKVPQGQARTVSRPDDLFNLAPGQWHFAKALWEGPGLCTPTQCEAGFTSAGLVISVEHAGEFVRIIAGLRGCESVGFSEVEVGTKPGKPTFGRVRKQVERVVKGVSKTCKLAAPEVPELDAAQLFPKQTTG